MLNQVSCDHLEIFDSQIAKFHLSTRLLEGLKEIYIYYSEINETDINLQTV